MRRFFVVLFLGFCLCALAPVDAGDDVRLRLKVHADAGERNWLSANGFDIAGHALREGWVEVITDPAGAQALRERGLRSELLELRDGPRPLGAGDPSGDQPPLPDTKYTDPAEVVAFLNQTVADHPAITRLEVIGTTHEGRAIHALLISDNAAVDEDELAILYSGQHHAREVMTPEIIMDTIDYLTDGYASDPQVQDWVDRHAIWCVVSVNPDGNNLVHAVDDFWRKNARDNDGNAIIDSQDGVDLNRNYEWGWGSQCLGSSSSFSSQTYRGPFEGSEPETLAMAALGNRIRPVFDVEYHSHGEDVFYAMSCDPVFNPKLTTIPGPNRDISRVIAEGYGAVIVQADGGVGYNVAPFGSNVDGTGRDHQYHDNGAIAFVTEVNNSAEGGFHPDYDTYRDVTVEGQRPGWQWLLDRISGPAIGGLVRDAVTGAPLGADVAVDEMLLPDGKRLSSRADTGRYHVIVVEGAYTLRVSKPGYQTAVLPVNVGPAWAPLDVDLQPTGASSIAADDMEDPATPANWSVGDPGDTASNGIWEWGLPHGTHAGNIITGLDLIAPRFDRTPDTGANAWVTGNAPSSSSTLSEVSGGVTTLVSPSYDLSGFYAVEASWQRWFRNEAIDPGDRLVAQVSNDGGANWFTLETLDTTTATPDASPAWTGTAVRLDDLVAPGADVRLRWQANDAGANHVVEAAIDDLELRGFETATQGQIANVRLDGGGTTAIDWDVLLGGPDATYDVARGDLANLAAGGPGVDLGPLTCIEENSADTSSSDAAVPAPGQGFFYVVRFELGLSVGEWGRGSAGDLRGGSGGCSP